MNPLDIEEKKNMLKEVYKINIQTFFKKKN